MKRLALIAGLVAVACYTPRATAPVGGAASNQEPLRGGETTWKVVMVLDSREVRRYENDLVVCFKVSSGGGGDTISCHDKP